MKAWRISYIRRRRVIPAGDQPVQADAAEFGNFYQGGVFRLYIAGFITRYGAGP
jgi:hypothetical protein